VTIDRTRLAALIVAAAVVAAICASIGGAASAATAPSNTVVPAVSGTATQGQTLSTSSGTWTGTTPITFTYAWQRCDSTGAACAAISGATQSQYTLTADDVGQTVRSAVTARNSGGTNTATSTASSVVRAAQAPTNGGAPTIAGTAAVGGTLTAANGSWSGTAPITYAYEWERCDDTGAACAAISGATASTYTLANADVDHTIRVRVTATNSAGQSSIESNATAVVKTSAPANTVAPTVSGTPTQAQALTVSDGTWVGSQPITYTYSWARCDTAGNNCATITGASTHAYLLAAADVAHTIRATVTATNSAGTNHVQTAAVGPVASNSTLPPGAVKLADGEISVPVADIGDTDRLTIVSVKYTPASFHGRGPLTATIKVIDSNKYVINGALLYVLPAPRNFANHPAEVATGQDGTATVSLTLTAAAPHRGAIMLFVRARTPQGDLLAGSSTRRLIQVRIFPS
jgi:fibronectin-binding autotransporter adhesin